jgi:hypothetical protein
MLLRRAKKYPNPRSSIDHTTRARRTHRHVLHPLFATAQSLRATPLAAPKRGGGARRAARAVRPVRTQAKKAEDVEPMTEPLSVSRRVLGLSSVLGAASLTTDLVFPTPAEAKKIVSGYTPLEGFDVRPLPPSEGADRAGQLSIERITRANNSRANRVGRMDVCQLATSCDAKSEKRKAFRATGASSRRR